MTKVYTVKPGSQEVRVSDGRVIMSREPIAWGEKLKSVETANLARIILVDVLGEELSMRAIALTQRFKWRTVMNWNKDMPHGITEDEVRGVISEIEKTENENRPFVQKMQREMPQYVTDRPAPGQEYKSNPDIVPNKPKEPK